MRKDIFISHVEEDSILALALADCLKGAGFTTWCYEYDSLPGVSYLLQTGQAIQECQAVLLIISVQALSSHQITKEVVRAHESNKPIFPLLLGVSHAQFQRRQPEWREAIGAAASLPIATEDLGRSVPKIVEGLKTLGIPACQTPSADTAKGNVSVMLVEQPTSLASEPESIPDDVQDEIESGEAYESIGDVWSAARVYGTVEAKLRALGKHELADEMKRRAKKNRSFAAQIMRGDM